MIKKQLGCSITQEAYNNLKRISAPMGKYPTGLANEILECFKDVEPENFYPALVELKKVGSKRKSSVS